MTGRLKDLTEPSKLVGGTEKRNPFEGAAPPRWETRAEGSPRFCFRKLPEINQS